MTSPDTTILLDIYERLGKIETKLEAATQNQKDMKEEVDELREFKSRLAAYIWLGGSIASGVLFFLYSGLKYAADRWLH